MVFRCYCFPLIRMGIFYQASFIVCVISISQLFQIDGQQSALSGGAPMFVLGGNEKQEDVCGTSINIPGMSRIINGNVAQYGNFPWSAALVHKTHKQYCAGTIINSEWILTAAHCVVGSLSVRDVVANVSIIVGSRSLVNVSESNTYKIGQIALFPGYEPRGWKNDLAVIKLKRPIPNFTDEIRPACLPKRSLEEQVRVTNYSTCFSPGWGYLQEKAGVPVFQAPTAAEVPSASGRTQLGSGTDTLMYARLNYVPLKTCQDKYYEQAMASQGKPEYVLDSMVCAASGNLNNLANPQGTCMGDSGGGMYCQEEDNSWVVHGIASWSGGCARKDLPSIFTNVFKLRYYVDRVISHRAG